MSGFNRFGFFLVVTAFAGSMVLLAAHQLRTIHLKRGGSEDPEAVRQLIQSLQGDALGGSWKAGNAAISQEYVPNRKPGQILHSGDRSGLNSVLKSVLPSNSGE